MEYRRNGENEEMNSTTNLNSTAAGGGGSTIGPNKAIASGLGGAIVTIVVWAVTVTGHSSVIVPPEVAAALTTLVSTALVWFVPHGSD